MTTKELIEEVQKLGFKVREGIRHLWIEDDGEIIVEDSTNMIAIILIDKVYNMDTNWSRFNNLDNDLKEKLYLLLSEYASTPIENRTLKKYILKTDYSFTGVNMFVLENVGSEYLSLHENKDIAMVFNDKDSHRIMDKYPFLERIEVEDDN